MFTPNFGRFATVETRMDAYRRTVVVLRLSVSQPASVGVSVVKMYL